VVRLFGIAASARMLGRARVASSSDAPMRRSKIQARSAADCFAWQYAFYTRLLYQKAPGTAAQLFDITQVRSCSEGSLGPHPDGQRDSSHLAIRFDGGSWTSIGERYCRPTVRVDDRRPSANRHRRPLTDVEIATVTGSSRPRPCENARRDASIPACCMPHRQAQ
jgi:hypothetical protein